MKNGCRTGCAAALAFTGAGAHTYAWQFDGPFLRDFTGAKPAGRRRDAGALEAQP